MDEVFNLRHPKALEVVGAVIVRHGLVLAAQRGPTKRLGGQWEFPGGKVEPGEAPDAALEREISEELGCGITVGEKITTTRHTYDFGVIELTTFYAELAAGEPRATEHAEVRWISPDDLSDLRWAEADLPTIAAIRSRSVE
ncbi:(deoxy)nucleoside triphosphate pyrophosphohydrolase [Microbacterium sp. 22215]|uniref:(deoxy)nucleoside triphosphate pyrophosphohydrolase n=1 Tax=Microbacterium sp. 22215 TaxID=3453893 RepID=UPI003F842760